MYRAIQSIVYFIAAVSPGCLLGSSLCSGKRQCSAADEEALQQSAAGSLPAQEV